MEHSLAGDIFLIISGALSLMALLSGAAFEFLDDDDEENRND